MKENENLSSQNEEMVKKLMELSAPLHGDPYFIFQNFILYRDLYRRATAPENIKDYTDEGEPIFMDLPNGISVDTALEQAKYWANKIRKHPNNKEIRESVTRHGRLVTASWEEMKKRNITKYTEWDGGRDYFPHVITDFWTGRANKFQMDTLKEFRAYLQNVEGSTKLIETDYVKAMWYHMASVHADNIHQDTILNFFKQFDQSERIREEIEQRAEKTGHKEKIQDVARQEGLVAFVPSDELSYHNGITIDRESLAKLLGVAIGSGPIQEELEKLGVKNLAMKTELLKDALIPNGKETWFLTPEVAAALRAINKEANEKKTLSDYLIGAPTTLWKKLMLFAPHNWFRYEFGNTVADTMKIFEITPEIFKHIHSAAKEIHAFFTGKGEITQEVREAFRHGVFDTVTEREASKLRDLPDFTKLKSDREKVKTILSMSVNFGLSTSRYREAIYRYALYRMNLERYHNGAVPYYGGAYWRDIEAMGESAAGAGDARQRKAAAISLASLVDYSAISKSGNFIRKFLMPFYSFQEANIRYYVNALRNNYDIALAKDKEANGIRAKSKAGAIAAVKTTPSFTARAAVGFATRMALPFVMMNVFNSIFFGDEEDEISAEDRRRPHIILGRDEDGRVRVVYLNNNFSEMLRWVGGNRFAGNAMDYITGRTDFTTAAMDWAAGAPGDILNNALGVGPIQKAAYTALSRKNAFPDALDQRSIPGSELKWTILSQMTDQTISGLTRSILDTDYYSGKSTWDWMSQAILQIRRRDPEQWAYYAIRDKAADYLETQTGRKVDHGTWDAPEAQVLRNFRRAIYRGDVEKAVRFYNRLLHYGYTADRFQSSLRAQDPLGDLPKKDGTRRTFIESLTPHEYQMLERAEAYYSRMTTFRGLHRGLFPPEASNPSATASRIEHYRLNPRDELLRQRLISEQEKNKNNRRLAAGFEIQQSLKTR